jgi:hypothetical protein
MVPSIFNTKENVAYVEPIPDISYYVADAMSESQRKQFLECYETQKSEIFNNRRVFEEYCQDIVTVLRQTCHVFRRKCMQIGRVEVFLESVAIASACSIVLRRVF